MKYIVRRDRFRRVRYNKLEIRRIMGCAILRSEFVGQTTIEQMRRYWCKKLMFRNRCIYTGRGKSISKYFGISRMKLLEMSREGDVKGARKGSW